MLNVLLTSNTKICSQVIFAALALTMQGSAAELKRISLPKPDISGGKPLMQALSERRTTREFKDNPLPIQVLANALWAGFGINRPQEGRRTAPSAMNSQELNIYVAMADGVYVYEAKSNELRQVVETDLRATVNGQPWAQTAPVMFIYVAELPKLDKAKADTRPFYAGIDAGCIVQNVYLFCASEGLATVVFDLDRARLASAMKLRPEQQIILAQALGQKKS
jgi:hypothetical protein